MIKLMEHQKDAIKNLGNGRILWGGVGSGKSATALGYYVKNEAPRNIFVITTAKKRDGLDWQGEAAKFGIGKDASSSIFGPMIVDSWNNIKKYTDVQDAFFIFDEQRLVGTGAWVKAFYKIARKNRWILLSGTPGDTWLDYAPVFIANGYFKNITEFKLKHVVYEPFSKYPKVRGYLNESALERLRASVLVEMPYLKTTTRVINYVDVEHDVAASKRLLNERWNVISDKPIKDAGELFRVLRRVTNSDPSRLEMVKSLLEVHDRIIIFYNFNYELEALRTLSESYSGVVAEWNGNKKEPIPDAPRWAYLVQYIAGAEGWNCTSTNVEILYSMTYSYKIHEQALGRIDRINTPFKELFYYIFVSNSEIDRGIKKALSEKRSFNVGKFVDEIQLDTSIF